MPTLQAPLQPNGALIDVVVSLSYQEIQRFRQAGKVIPQPIAVSALLDTGADMSCIDPTILQRIPLPLQAVNLSNIPALGGPLATPLRDAGLRIVHSSGDPHQELVIGDQLLAEVPLGVLGYELLLGRDVLQLCRFVYDGLADEFELAWR